MTMTKDAKKPTFIMEFVVESPLGTERIRTMSKAWERSMELPPPVSTRFVGLVRETPTQNQHTG